MPLCIIAFFLLYLWSCPFMPLHVFCFDLSPFSLCYCSYAPVPLFPSVLHLCSLRIILKNRNVFLYSAKVTPQIVTIWQCFLFLSLTGFYVYSYLCFCIGMPSYFCFVVFYAFDCIRHTYNLSNFNLTCLNLLPPWWNCHSVYLVLRSFALTFWKCED